MAELVDALDSKSCSFGSAGSIPASGTNKKADVQASAFLLLSVLALTLALHVWSYQLFCSVSVRSECENWSAYNKVLTEIFDQGLSNSSLKKCIFATQVNASSS